MADQMEFGLDTAICAWCRPVAMDGFTLAPTLSHGICPKHFKKLALSVTRLRNPASTPVRRPRRKSSSSRANDVPLLL